MDKRYDSYGFKSTTLEAALALVQQVLGLELRERDSSYYAGTYYLYKLEYGRVLRLYRNHDPELGFVRGEYSDYAVILEVSDLDEMEEIQRKLMSGIEGISLLSSTRLRG